MWDGWSRGSFEMLGSEYFLQFCFVFLSEGPSYPRQLGDQDNSRDLTTSLSQLIYDSGPLFLYSY